MIGLRPGRITFTTTSSPLFSCAARTWATEAEANGQKLRYVATFENGKVTIELRAVDADHPFYTLSGADNIISFNTERYKERPLVIKGPGAGAEVTASGVFADMVSIGSYLG